MARTPLAAFFNSPDIAEYVRVPFADADPLKVPLGIKDEEVLFPSDNFPTGYQAAENCQVQERGTIAVWGYEPFGKLPYEAP